MPQEEVRGKYGGVDSILLGSQVIRKLSSWSSVSMERQTGMEDVNVTYCLKDFQVI